LALPQKEPPSSAALVGAGKKGTSRKSSPAMAGQGSQRTKVIITEWLILYAYNLSLTVQSLQLVV
jgi:hypothetical protein